MKINFFMRFCIQHLAHLRGIIPAPYNKIDSVFYSIVNILIMHECIRNTSHSREPSLCGQPK